MRVLLAPGSSAPGSRMNFGAPANKSFWSTLMVPATADRVRAMNRGSFEWVMARMRFTPARRFARYNAGKNFLLTLMNDYFTRPVYFGSHTKTILIRLRPARHSNVSTFHLKD